MILFLLAKKKRQLIERIGMKTIKKVCFCLLLCLGCIGCSPSTSLDFWTITYDQIERYLNESGNLGDDWHIGLQGKDLAVDKDYPELTIHKYGDQQECVLSFQMDAKDKPYIVYRYTMETKAALGRTKQKSLELTSTDAGFTKYDMKYTEMILEDGNFISQDTASGILQMQEDQTLRFDSIPLLKESMENLNAMIDDIEKTFDIDYTKTSFVNVPALTQKTNIPKTEEIPEETADNIVYFSKPDINAKGFSLVTCLEINKANPGSAVFSEFNVERQSDEFSYNISLEKQSQENCYALVFPFDSDFSYIVYIDETQAYLYDASFTVKKMVQDVAQGGSQAVFVLSTENESYKE